MSQHSYNFSISFLVALSTTSNSQNSEKHRLLEGHEDKNIAGEYNTMNNHAVTISSKERRRDEGISLETTGESIESPPSRKSPMKRSPKSPRESPKIIAVTKANKKGLHLQLNVQAAARHSMQRNFHTQQNTPLLTPGSRGTPKRRCSYTIFVHTTQCDDYHLQICSYQTKFSP